jgi:glutamate 5-kinase
LLAGVAVGTRLKSATAPMAARKQWLADHLQTRGSLVLDDGAAWALAAGGRSLLAVGVQVTTGEFGRGEVVDCRDGSGRLVARGLVNYSASETRRIMGRPSVDFESILGYVNETELIHRDNLVLL